MSKDFADNLIPDPPRGSIDVILYRLDEMHETMKGVAGRFDKHEERIESLEATRQAQRTAGKILTYGGGLGVALIGAVEAMTNLFGVFK